MTEDKQHPASQESERSDVRVLSNTTIAIAGILLVTTGVALASWLVAAYGADGQQLEAIKTAGTFVIGAGGAAALYLAARRQRSNEIALRQKEVDQEQADQAHALQAQVAADTKAHQQRLAAAGEAEVEERRRSEIERRITDTYAKAVDQLGSEKAPVRLASLYALERLAQDNENQRQMIVNVLCAYLRMPFATSTTEYAAAAESSNESQQTQEQQVRTTAQRILLDHVCVRSDDGRARFWPDISLDLSGAVLIDFDAAGCTVSGAMFSGAAFTGRAIFRDAVFAGPARFDDVRFSEDANFVCARFIDDARFDRVRFGRDSRFREARFDKGAHFTEAQIVGYGRFRLAQFEGDTWFTDARFHDAPWYSGARFAGYPDFSGALVRTGDAVPDDGWPNGWNVRELEPGEDHPDGRREDWRRFVRVKRATPLRPTSPR